MESNGLHSYNLFREFFGCFRDKVQEILFQGGGRRPDQGKLDRSEQFLLRKDRQFPVPEDCFRGQGHQGDSHAHLDVVQRGLDGIGGDRKLRGEAELGKTREQLQGPSGVFLNGDPAFAGEIAFGPESAGGETMVCGNDERHRNLRQPHHVEGFVLGRRGKGNGRVDLVLREHGDCMPSVRFENAREKGRVFFHQFADQEGKVMGADHRRASEPQGNGGRVPERRQPAVDVVEEVRKELHERLSLGREREGFAAEQRHADVVFQFPELKADGRLLDAVGDDPDRVADALGLDDVIEQFQMMKIDIHERVSPNERKVPF